MAAGFCRPGAQLDCPAQRGALHPQPSAQRLQPGVCGVWRAGREAWQGRVCGAQGEGAAAAVLQPEEPAGRLGGWGGAYLCGRCGVMRYGSTAGMCSALPASPKATWPALPPRARRPHPAPLQALAFKEAASRVASVVGGWSLVDTAVYGARLPRQAAAAAAAAGPAAGFAAERRVDTPDLLLCVQPQANSAFMTMQLGWVWAAAGSRCHLPARVGLTAA